MKGQYNFVQTVHTGPQGSVPVPVKHDYEGAVPMTESVRLGTYLRQNNQSDAGAGGGYYEDYDRELTTRQVRQLRHQIRRATMRAAKTLSPVARDMVLGRPRSA